MAAMTMMPLSLLPIYLSLNATSHVASAGSFQILDTLSKTIPDSTANKRLVDTAEEVARAKGKDLREVKYFLF
jgi:amyloid beta precursor protein binding protein 1